MKFDLFFQKEKTWVYITFGFSDTAMQRNVFIKSAQLLSQAM